MQESASDRKMYRLPQNGPKPKQTHLPSEYHRAKPDAPEPFKPQYSKKNASDRPRRQPSQMLQKLPEKAIRLSFHPRELVHLLAGVIAKSLV
jgi:hypothetical protein